MPKAMSPQGRSGPQGRGHPVIQKLLGHKDLKTTQIYTHVAETDMSRLAGML